MPKKKDRKIKTAIKAGYKVEPGTGEEGMDLGASDDDDTMSIATHMSLDDNESLIGDAGLGDLSELDESGLKILADRLREAIDNANHRNTKIRSVALKSLVSAFRKYFLSDILMDWKVTLIDGLEKAVRKSDILTQTDAVRLAGLLAVQLGMDVAEDLAKLVSMLRPIACDVSQPIELRKQCCMSVGIYCLMCAEEVEELTSCALTFRSIWGGFKTNCGSECGPLFAASLAMWTMVTIHPRSPLSGLKLALKDDLPKLCSYLDSPHLDFRLATGESLATIYESAYDSLTDFRGLPNHFTLLNQFQELASDSAKYHAKKDKRIQRATFRDIFGAIKAGEAPDQTVKFGAESLFIDCWWTKLLYDTICTVLGSGVNLHMKENTLIRECFGLGAPVTSSQIKRLSKFERQSINATLCKARTQLRSKQRGCKERLSSFSAA